MEPPETLPVELARSRAAAAAELLARDPRVRLVFLFGSAADPDARQVGDVDLAIWCQPPLEPFDRFRLADELELALGGPVDLVVLNRAPVVLAAEVASTGRCLFARDPDE
nr:nucleotidyltransferase domain-containing protein [Thermoanaerobaculia bacterium]